ncbi:Xaa-Pro aminopeptidase 1 OS=Streptomyces glaucescens OX=1907 GN=pepPI PE=3 SV=1 [Streptomyces glaucescens]
MEPTAAGHRETMIRPAPTARTASSGWTGRASCGWAAATPSPRRRSGTAFPASDVRELAGALQATGPVRVVRGYDAGIEAALTDKVTAERDEELRVFLSEMRLVKDEFEIGELQKAVDSTVRGFEDVVKVLDKAEATSERYIEGTFFLRARVEGNDVGYGSICAAGPHACTLHWVRNDGPGALR